MLLKNTYSVDPVLWNDCLISLISGLRGHTSILWSVGPMQFPTLFSALIISTPPSNPVWNLRLGHIYIILNHVTTLCNPVWNQRLGHMLSEIMLLLFRRYTCEHFWIYFDLQCERFCVAYFKEGWVNGTRQDWTKEGKHKVWSNDLDLLHW